jgi:hypothetical protein
MKTEKIIWGLVLVFVGSILLLQNFGVISFYWEVIFKFWPVILILIGANLLFSRNESVAGVIVPVLITLLALGFITYKGITTKESEDSKWSYDFDFDEDDSNHDEHESGSNVFTEQFKPGTEKAILNISGGAIHYIIQDSTNNLFDANVSKHFGNFSLLSTSQDSIQVLDFKMKGKSEVKNYGSNKANLKLNRNPVWDINLEMGAGKTDFDLSGYKIASLNIKGGAAKYDIKLGTPIATTNVLVETGVSKVHFEVPESAACKINVESGMSSNDFKGFIKQGDGSYITANFKNAEKTIIINLKGGLSKFEVDRY